MIVTIDNLVYSINKRSKIATFINIYGGYSNPILQLPESINHDGVEYVLKCIDLCSYINIVKKLIIPDTVEKIKGTLSYLSNLRCVVFGKKIKEVPDYCFKYLDTLEQVIFNDSIEIIGTRAFFGCTYLKGIKLPKKLKSIGYDAFWNCNKLDKIVFPKTVELIGLTAFSKCSKLVNNIYFEGPIPILTLNSLPRSKSKLNFINVKPEYLEGFISNKKFSKKYMITDLETMDQYFSLAINKELGKVVPNLDVEGNNTYSGDIIIPRYYPIINDKEVEYVKITEIDPFSFVDCPNLNTIELRKELDYLQDDFFIESHIKLIVR